MGFLGKVIYRKDDRWPFSYVYTHTEENGDPFSVLGNGEVRDDITDDSSKEFLTIKTKNNNTFYIVIDRAATTNNVYMLSQIDENDLKEFLDEDQQQTLETAPSVVLEDEHTDDTETVVIQKYIDGYHLPLPSNVPHQS